MYCPRTGTRLSPTDGNVPSAGTAVAVVVFDNGTTLSVRRHTTMGRAPETDRFVTSQERAGIRVEDPDESMSRAHLLLRVTDWEVEVIDLGSRNGTFVQMGDGVWRRLMPGLAYRVADGQVVRLGGRSFSLYHSTR